MKVPVEEPFALRFHRRDVPTEVSSGVLIASMIAPVGRVLCWHTSLPRPSSHAISQSWDIAPELVPSMQFSLSKLD